MYIRIFDPPAWGLPNLINNLQIQKTRFLPSPPILLLLLCFLTTTCSFSFRISAFSSLSSLFLSLFLPPSLFLFRISLLSRLLRGVFRRWVREARWGRKVGKGR